MLCSSCEKNIPFWGETCPYCGQDKSSDQSIRLLALGCVLAVCGFGFLLGGYPGLALSGALGVLIASIAVKLVTGHHW